MPRRLLAPLLLLTLASPGPTPAEAAPEPRARAVVQAFLKAYEAVQTFQGRIRSETRRGAKVDVARSRLWMRKPATTAFEMLESGIMPAAVGTKLVWHGEAKCSVKTRFFGLPVKLETGFDDPRLAGVRGWNLREISIASVVRLLEDPRSTFRFVRNEAFLGRPMAVIEARGPLVLRGTDREVIWIDDRLKLPFALEAWDEDERALRVEIEAFEFDAELAPGTLSLD